MKIHIIILYRTDGIECILERFPAYLDEQAVKNLVKALNKQNSVVGTYNYITKDVV
jgi:hypothetical protein